MSVDYAKVLVVGKFPTEREAMTNPVITEGLEFLERTNSKLDAVQPLAETVATLMEVANTLGELKMFAEVNKILEVSNALLEIVNARLNA